MLLYTRQVLRYDETLTDVLSCVPGRMVNKPSPSAKSLNHPSGCDYELLRQREPKKAAGGAGADKRQKRGPGSSGLLGNEKPPRFLRPASKWSKQAIPGTWWLESVVSKVSRKIFGEFSCTSNLLSPTFLRFLRRLKMDQNALRMRGGRNEVAPKTALLGHSAKTASGWNSGTQSSTSGTLADGRRVFFVTRSRRVGRLALAQHTLMGAKRNGACPDHGRTFGSTRPAMAADTTVPGKRP